MTESLQNSDAIEAPTEPSTETTPTVPISNPGPLAAESVLHMIQLLSAAIQLSNDPPVMWYPGWYVKGGVKVQDADHLVALTTAMDDHEFAGIKRLGGTGPWAQAKPAGSGK